MENTVKRRSSTRSSLLSKQQDQPKSTEMETSNLKSSSSKVPSGSDKLTTTPAASNDEVEVMDLSDSESITEVPCIGKSNDLTSGPSKNSSEPNLKGSTAEEETNKTTVEIPSAVKETVKSSEKHDDIPLDKTDESKADGQDANDTETPPSKVKKMNVSKIAEFSSGKNLRSQTAVKPTEQKSESDTPISEEDNDDIAEIIVINSASSKTDKNKTKTPITPKNVPKDQEEHKETPLKTSQASESTTPNHEEQESSLCQTSSTISEWHPEKNVASTSKKLREKCCNSDCFEYGSNFETASGFIRGYFKINESKKKDLKVCKSCYQMANEFYKLLLLKADNQEPIIESVGLIPRKKTVVLDDSDDEMEDDTEDLKYELEIGLIDDVIMSVHKNMNLDSQTTEGDKIVNSLHAEVLEKMRELENIIDSLQKDVDITRNHAYQPWTPNYDEKTPIEIIDVAPNVASTKPTRMVAMKRVTQMQPKPVTSRYNDQQQEIVDLGEVSESPAESVPPSGRYLRKPVRVGDFVYAMKIGLFGEWLKARVLEITSKPGGEMICKVRFAKISAHTRNCTPKQIAYCEVSPVMLEVGTRVIAVFHNNEHLELEDKNEKRKKEDGKDHFYAGIIAEPLKSINRHRYLVFFDDGFTQYVSHSKVMVVVGSSTNVWDDIHPDSKEFIHNYLQQYPERPMVKLQVGQVIKTEWNTRWWIARVKKVDCSLVLVHFDADSRTEWIYRGSMRLGPLYSEFSKKEERKKAGGVRAHRSLGTSAHHRANGPYVEYTRGPDVEVVDEQSHAPRSVARKSTGGNATNLSEQNLSRYNRMTSPDHGHRENRGSIQYQRKHGKSPKDFRPHQCNSRCIVDEEYSEGSRVMRNPLLIPVFHGWERYFFIHRAGKFKTIFYRGPCGRRLRSLSEVHRYLRITKSKLVMDLFSFDSAVHLFATFIAEGALFSIKDISYSKEKVPISCMNTVNREYPNYVDYSRERLPNGEVKVNCDPSFLVCCDCTDDCRNKATCSCWQLSHQEAKVLTPHPEVDKVGYKYRRLPNGAQRTGIYECNINCKCSKNCLNRVVQNPMKQLLQLFRTERRGWGIRAIHDMPAGTFLCIYAGQILTEQDANQVEPLYNVKEGKLYGDEYLAELDYIEVVERTKEGYESDVSELSEEEDEEESAEKQDEEKKNSKKKTGARRNKDSDSSSDEHKQGSDSEFTVHSDVRASLAQPAVGMTLRKRRENRASTSKENDGEEQDSQGDSKKKGEVSAPGARGATKKFQSVRIHYENSEDIFVMDAKSVGNIGRYFNHSCDPNVFVQNVFVDSHDLRFPWVAFFTSRYIRAGTELCWDYNYEIDSVSGRRMDCYCGSINCKGRLL